MSLAFRQNTSTVSDVLGHLTACDASFDPPLSSRVELAAYAKKLVARAVRFEAWSDEILVGLVATYCDALDTGRGFVSSVSVLPCWGGQGVAAQLMKRCLDYASGVGLQLLQLEVSRFNRRAVGLYTGLGFVDVSTSSEGTLTMMVRLAPLPP